MASQRERPHLEFCETCSKKIFVLFYNTAAQRALFFFPTFIKHKIKQKPKQTHSWLDMFKFKASVFSISSISFSGSQHSLKDQKTHIVYFILC